MCTHVDAPLAPMWPSPKKIITELGERSRLERAHLELEWMGRSVESRVSRFIIIAEGVREAAEELLNIGKEGRICG